MENHFTKSGEATFFDFILLIHFIELLHGTSGKLLSLNNCLAELLLEFCQTGPELHLAQLIP